MPAQRLGNHAVPISKYDVAAQDSEAVPDFIRHVGLSDEQGRDVRLDTEIALVHMGPPLKRGDTGNPIQAVGTAGLTISEIRQVGVFVDEHISEYRAEEFRGYRQYVIHPHVREPDEHVACRRFSCAGFVIEAYRDAGIDLVETGTERLPGVSLETLTDGYPEQAPHLSHPQIRSHFGLEGDPPWAVVMAGYVLNALDRSEAELRKCPYQPASGDEFFPSKRGQSP